MVNCIFHCVTTEIRKGTIGIHGHQDPHEVARLDGMLMLPFKGEVEGYAINRRDWRGEHATR